MQQIHSINQGPRTTIHSFRFILPLQRAEECPGASHVQTGHIITILHATTIKQVQGGVNLRLNEDMISESLRLFLCQVHCPQTTGLVCSSLSWRSTIQTREISISPWNPANANWVACINSHGCLHVLLIRLILELLFQPLAEHIQCKKKKKTTLNGFCSHLKVYWWINCVRYY
jgi:hypothetical protein